MLAERDRSHYTSSKRFATDRYTTREHHRLEVDHVWVRCWQIACLESDVAVPGAFHEYSIVDETLVVVRDDDGTLRALVNVCPDCGTPLCAGHGTAASLRCRRGGCTFALDGSRTDAPGGLRAFHVDTWAGFVFVNLDRTPPPLTTFLGPLATRFDDYALERRRRSVGISTVLPCNWKLALAAFPEAYHVPWTHPQAAFHNSDVTTSTELLGAHGRLTIPRLPSPNNASPYDDDELLEEYLAATPDDLELASAELAAGRSVTAALVAVFRRRLARLGVETDHVAGDELAVTDGYLIFPNVVAYAGLTSHGITWRFRPNGDEHETCIADLWLLTFPAEGEQRSNAEIVHHPMGTSFTEALGGGNPLGPVFDQDLSNLAGLQRAHRSAHFDGPLYGRYQEALVRNFEEALDRLIGEGLAVT